jgi:methionyl-tRNA formyltransferase
MRLGFCGSPPFAVPVLDALVDAGHEVALVVTRPDTRRGRGATATPTAVKAAATRLSLPVTDDVADLVATGAALAVVVAYGALVPAAVLATVPMLNLHFSLLPRWRGAAPVERAILAGDEDTGVCVMGLEATLDTGPVYARATTPVGDKTLADLRAELVTLGIALLVPLLDGGLAGLPAPVPQHGEASYAKKLRPEELELDFARPARELARVVRVGGARTSAGARRLVVREAEVLEEAPGPPGTLTGDVVACGDGGLRLVSIVPEGRRAMTPSAWARGLRDGAPARLGPAMVP